MLGRSGWYTLSKKFCGWQSTDHFNESFCSPDWFVHKIYENCICCHISPHIYILSLVRNAETKTYISSLLVGENGSFDVNLNDNFCEKHNNSVSLSNLSLSLSLSLSVSPPPPPLSLSPSISLLVEQCTNFFGMEVIYAGCFLLSSFGLLEKKFTTTVCIFYVCVGSPLRCTMFFQALNMLTRSLPQDVYIRRQNDHPGGQGRIYTSHLNFVSTHLSKPGHRRGCCCMSPRCLLRQFVVRCLLFWAFFIEKTVLLCFARFLSKWRESALWMIPDATSWYELYVWWLSLRRRTRRELVSFCWKRGRRITVDICWERKLVTGEPGRKKTTLLLWTKTSTYQLTVNARLAIAFVEGSSVRIYEHRCEWNIASQL